MSQMLDMRHPGFCGWFGAGTLRFVLSHPFRDETAERMGHPGFFLMGKRRPFGGSDIVP
jgi:hypothetical protein